MCGWLWWVARWERRLYFLYFFFCSSSQPFHYGGVQVNARFFFPGCRETLMAAYPAGKVRPRLVCVRFVDMCYEVIHVIKDLGAVGPLAPHLVPHWASGRRHLLCRRGRRIACPTSSTVGNGWPMRKEDVLAACQQGRLFSSPSETSPKSVNGWTFATCLMLRNQWRMTDGCQPFHFL